MTTCVLPRAPSVIACIVGLAILASAVAATAGDTPTVQGNVKHLHFEFGPLDIRPGQNLIETNKFAIPQPKIDGWIVGFRPNLRLTDGSVPPVDEIHLHHGVWLTGTRLDATALFPERFLGVGEEKTELKMPPGYGYRYTPSDYWWINYMIHNLTERPFKLSITYDVDMVPASNAPPGGMKDVHPIWMDVQNGSVYPVFDVLKGSGTGGTFTYPDQATDPYAGGSPKNEWTVKQPGVLVHTFGHLHPGGLHVDLDLLRDGKDTHLFESTAKYYEPAGAVSWDVSMTATRKDWAVAVQPGDVLKISATYDTSRASWYESMGLAVVWMYNGPGGDDPFVKKVDRPGVLTHGHLPENNNHGGKKTTLKEPDQGRLGPDDARASTSRTSSTARATSPPASRSPRSRRVSRSRSTTWTPMVRKCGTRSPRARRRAPPRRASPTRSPTAASRSTPANSAMLARPPRGPIHGAPPPICRSARTPISAVCIPSCAAPSASSP